jgi:hypothetical protein
MTDQARKNSGLILFLPFRSPELLAKLQRAEAAWKQGVAEMIWK